MPTFSDLPPELVLEVCDFLYSGSPKIIEQAFATIQHTSFADSDIRNVMRDGWNDLFNLSSTSRRYRELIVDQQNSVYRIITVHGNDTVHGLSKYLSLLRFLDAKPQVAASVKTLYLSLVPQDTTSAMAKLEPNDLDFVRKQAAAAEISFTESLWERPKDLDEQICPHFGGYWAGPMEVHGEACDDCIDEWDDGDDTPGPYDYERMGILVSLILHKTRCLQQFGCAVFGDFFRKIGDGKTCALPTLPELQYLAISSDHEQEHISPHDFEVLTDLGHSAAYLHLNDVGSTMDIVEPGTLYPLMFENVAHLVVTGSTFGDASLSTLLESCCRPLTTFKFIPTMVDYEINDYHGPSVPQQVVDALLSNHAESLRTLCIDFGSMENYSTWDSLGGIKTLEGFVNLENLWLDCDSIFQPYDDTEDSDSDSDEETTTLITSLPRTLQRICFVDFDDIYNADMLWLAENRKSFPRLQSIELDKDLGDIISSMTDSGFKPSLVRVKEAVLWETN